MSAPTSSVPSIEHPKIVSMSQRDKWRIEHAIQAVADEPRKHVTVELEHDDRHFVVLVYERNNVRVHAPTPD